MERGLKFAAGSREEYALKIATLFSLRCLRHQNDGEFWIAFNVDGFGPFGDILLHHAGITYMLHLNCDDDPENAKKRKCLTPTGDLTFLECFSGLDELILTLESKVAENEFLNQTCELDDLCFLFYTNKKVGECEAVEHFHDNLFFLDLNAKVSKVDYKTISANINLVKNFNFKGAYLCVDEKRAKDVDVEITKEIRKTVDFPKTDIESFAKEFTAFIANYLAESHYLAKQEILCRFAELIFRNYEVSLACERLGYQSTDKLKIWNKITQNQIITVVESDEIILKFLVEYINYGIENLFKNLTATMWTQTLSEEEIELFKKEHENLGTKTLGKSEKTTLLDIYKVLWMNKRLPLLLEVNDIQDYVIIRNVLNISKNSIKIILLNKSSQSLTRLDSTETGMKPFESLQDLDETERRTVLKLPIKLQGKSDVLLEDTLDETTFQFLGCSDLIKIILGNFNVGNKFSECENFVDRSVSKVFIKLQALDEILDETFLIEDCENIFDTLATKSTNVLNVKDVEVLQPGIVISNDKTTLERLEKPKLTETIHHLTIHDRRHLEWKYSFGSIEKIKKFRVELKDRETNAISDWTKPVTIINGHPGIGKSTLMDFVAQQAPVNKWILRINLTEHQDYYNRIKNVEKDALMHLNYFRDSCFNQNKCKTKLNKVVFKKYAATKNIFVLLDGFDEVSVCYKEEVAGIAKSLHQEGYQIWITTRPVTKPYLEELFDTFSVNLDSFTFENQKQILINHFSALGLDSEDLVMEYATKLLQLANKNFNDNDNEFVGSPLYIKLLAETFSDECKNFLYTNGSASVTENIDLLCLYENFVDNKITILCDKLKAVEQNERSKLKEHQALFALKLLFPLHDHSDVDRELEHYRNEPTKIQLLQREGVITVDEKLNVNFTHRTFAEYIAAQWLTENIHHKKAQTLMKERFSPDYKFLFDIFDRFLAKDLPLHLAVMNKQFDDAKRIINSDLSSVTALDETGRSVLHIVALYSVQFPLLFHETAHFFPDSEAIHFLNLKAFERDAALDIIEQIPDCNISDIKKDILGCNPLDYALANNSLAAAHKIYSKLKPSTINVSINLNYKKSYLGYCALLDYKSLFDLLLTHFASRDFLLKTVNGNVNVTTYFQSIYSGNMYTNSILDYKIDYGAMTILNLLQSKSAYSGYINGHYSDLRYAIIFDSKDDVEKLLKATLEINTQDHDNNTPLHYTALHGRPEIAQLLLFRGAKLDTLNYFHDTALNIALRENYIEIATMLVANGANGNLENRKGQTPLHYAIEKGYYEIAKKILSTGELNDKQNVNGNTPLHFALKKDQPEIAKLLLSKGSNGNKKNRLGETPLHYAVQNNYIDIVHEIIVKDGVNNSKNICDNTPLHLALIKNLTDIAELLIFNCTDVDIQNGDGKTALHLACQIGSKDIVEKILTLSIGIDMKNYNRADLNLANNRKETLPYAANQNDNTSVLNKYHNNIVNKQDFHCNTAIHFALKKGFHDIATILLSNGADINIKNRSCETPLHLLIENNYDGLKNILSERSINSRRNRNDNTPLHLALIKNELEIAELLILKGADVNKANEKEGSALHCAVERGYHDIVNLILTTKQIYLDQKNCDGNTALHLALMKKDFNTAEMLLLRGANVEIENHQRDTPLSYALQNGYDVITKKMLSKTSVDHNWTKDSNTLLHLALMNGQVEAAEMLILSGADINKVNKNRETAFFLAVRNGSCDLAEKLIVKSNVNARQRKDGNTPLHWALVRDDINTVKLLIANGADVNIGNKRGKTALHCAAKKGNITMVKEVLSAKNINVNKQSRKGDTPLHIACLKGLREIAKLLLFNGADISILDCSGKTAQDLACQCGGFNVIPLLETHGNDPKHIE